MFALDGALYWNTHIMDQNYQLIIRWNIGRRIIALCIFTEITENIWGELNAQSAPWKWFGKKFKKWVKFESK